MRAASSTAGSTGSAASSPLRKRDARQFQAGGRSSTPASEFRSSRDVVGVAGEPVEGVHGRPLRRGEQPGRQEVGAPMLGVEPCSTGRTRAGARPRCRRRATRCWSCAYSFRRDDCSSVRMIVQACHSRSLGQPPGQQQRGGNAHARHGGTAGQTALSTPRTRLAGRNGPVWGKGVRQRERRARGHAPDGPNRPGSPRRGCRRRGPGRAAAAGRRWRVPHGRSCRPGRPN